MTKKRTSVYVDQDKLKALMDAKVIRNVSDAVDRLIDALSADEMEEVYVEAKLASLDDSIEKTKLLVAETQYDLQNLVNRLEYLKQKKVAIQRDWEAAQNTIVLVKHVRRLNEVIVISKYDECAVQVAAKEIIGAITDINPAFDLHAHITRLKRIRTS